MSDLRAKQKLAGIFIDAADVDIRHATIDPSLSKVWNDESTGELAVSIERVLFDGLLEVATRYLEPHGFTQNLENLLAILDTVRFGVQSHNSSKTASDGRPLSKKLMPCIYMHLPRKNTVGPLLQKFYDEISKYEQELARLQDFENKSKKAVDAAVKDESGKKAIDVLQRENQQLREELSKLGKRLAVAEQSMQSAPSSSSDSILPSGVKNCTIRSVRPSDGIVSVKSGDQQFSVPLKLIGGTPVANARALSIHEGGILKSLWVFDPLPEPFSMRTADVLGIEGRRVKLRFSDRQEQIIQMADSKLAINPNSKVLAKFAKGYLVELSTLSPEADSHKVDILFDAQTKRQLELANLGDSHD